MPQQEQAHIPSHHEWGNANAVLVFWLDDRPHHNHAHAEQQRFANKPQEAEPLPPKAGHDFAHHQCANDPALTACETGNAHDPALMRRRGLRRGAHHRLAIGESKSLDEGQKSRLSASTATVWPSP